jgi:hypothetical protein
MAAQALVNALNARDEQQRRYAASAVASLAGSDDGADALCSSVGQEPLAEALTSASLLSTDSPNPDALGALANLCARSDCRALAIRTAELCKPSLTDMTRHCACQSPSAHALAALLHNLCASPDTAPHLGEHAFDLLKLAFDTDSHRLGALPSAAASVLQATSARNALASKRDSACALLARCIASSSEPEENRIKAAECLKNQLLVDDDARSQCIGDGDGELVSAVKALVGSLSADSDRRDQSNDVRFASAEALLALASASSAGRRALWHAEGPGKLQEGYKLESVQQINELMESMAELIVQHGLTSTPEKENASKGH